jgi:hypothetical protein
MLFSYRASFYGNVTVSVFAAFIFVIVHADVVAPVHPDDPPHVPLPVPAVFVIVAVVSVGTLNVHVFW